MTRVLELAQIHLAMLWKNGQIGREWILGWKGHSLSAYVWLPEGDALDSRHESDWVRGSALQIRKVLGERPRAALLGDVPSPPPAWQSARSLVLAPRPWSRGSPVLHGERPRAIPIYALPLTPSEREGLQSWRVANSAAYDLWIESATLEREAYRALADPRGAHLRAGRRWAALLEERTGRPTYVFLLRYHGRRSGEGRRRCPLCGRAWRAKWDGDALSFLGIEFKCDPCRIVSEIGADASEPVLARHGEFVRRRGR